MKKNFFVIVALFILYQAGFGQGIVNFYDSEMDQTKPFLISEVSTDSQDGGEKLFHTLEQAYAAFNEDRNFILAIRVCSDYPLSVVFTNPAYNVSDINYLIKEQFNSVVESIILKNVYLLKNNVNCIRGRKHKLTEFWLIPKNSDFPEFAEIAKLNEFQTSYTEESGKYRRKQLIDSFKVDAELISSEKSDEPVFLTLSNYSIFKKNLLKLLRKDKLSYVLIEYPNYGKSRKNIYNQALNLKRFLTENHIRQNRIFIKYCDSKECEFDFSVKNSIYPNVISVYKD